jgi:phenylalanine ammonia-lyase
LQGGYLYVPRKKDYMGNITCTIHNDFTIDSNSLDLASVIAATYHNIVPELTTDPEVTSNITTSVDILIEHLTKGYNIYSVNTGFRGSADGRSNK